MSPAVPWLKFRLPVRVWVWSLVRQLRSHMTCGQKPKPKQKQYCNKFNKDFKNSPHQKKTKTKTTYNAQDSQPHATDGKTEAGSDWVTTSSAPARSGRTATPQAMLPLLLLPQDWGPLPVVPIFRLGVLFHFAMTLFRSVTPLFHCCGI